MKAKFINLLWLAIFLFMAGCSEFETDNAVVPDDATLKSSSVTKGYIVELKSEDHSSLDFIGKKNKSLNRAMEVLKRTSLNGSEITSVYGAALQGFTVKIPPGQLKKLELDMDVLRVEEDIVVELAPKKKPSPTPVPTQVTPWGVSRVGGAVASSGVAWIIDSGIDMDHPDLNVDANRSAVFITGKNVTPDDQAGHGTHVAGIIAAKDNNFGVVGVAAGASVVSVRVLDRKGSGYVSWIIAGVDYVAANAVAGDVVNMSLGGGISDALDQAVMNAAQTGVRFVLAAGNEAMDASNSSPARVEAPNVFTISAMDSNDYFASFSNYGSVVDYCAPGVGIYSTYMGAAYATMSGTSMAAPHVAGLLLLGNLETDGSVLGDPDGNPDPIAHH